jgi:hypothetical protein
MCPDIRGAGATRRQNETRGSRRFREIPEAWCESTEPPARYRERAEDLGLHPSRVPHVWMAFASHAAGVGRRSDDWAAAWVRWVQKDLEDPRMYRPL